jgi:hypothetical protein
MKRLLLALLLLGAALEAAANDYTDIWYNPAQQGYGFNFVQSNQFIFATFFVYGAGGQPTWLVAGLDWDGLGSYTGNLYAATGTSYGAPWNPANYAPAQVGTAAFTPSAGNNWQGTLNYVVQSGVAGTAATPDKVATAVTVSIERQTLAHIPSAGAYAGALVSYYSGCETPANNGSVVEHYELAVIQNENTSTTYQFRAETARTCTLTGVQTPHGQYYEMFDAVYSCSDGLITVANIRQIKVTDLGIEGIIEAANVGDSCRLTAKFGGPLL